MQEFQATREKTRVITKWPQDTFRRYCFPRKKDRCDRLKLKQAIPRDHGWSTTGQFFENKQVSLFCTVEWCAVVSTTKAAY